MPKNEEMYPLGRFSQFVIHDLPRFNQQGSNGDISAFFNKGVALLPDTSKIAETIMDSVDTAASVLGDIGMFASTLNRNGLAVSSSSRLVDNLLLLGSRTGLPPRDNYYSYTERNSPGADARTYTGHPEEHLMVFYNQQFCSEFGTTADTLTELVRNGEWPSPTIDAKIQAAAGSLARTNRLMLAVRQNVSSEVFSASRKFTAPIEIPGASWLIDGKPTTHVTNIDADSNIALIDLILYGSDETHARYLQQLYPHFPTFRRQLFEELVSSDFQSIEECFVSEEANLPDTVRDGIVDIFKQMWSWRSMHNSAVTTHLRMKGKGQNPHAPGFEYDEKLLRLLNRSKNGYQRVLAASK